MHRAIIRLTKKEYAYLKIAIAVALFIDDSDDNEIIEMMVEENQVVLMLPNYTEVLNKLSPVHNEKMGHYLTNGYKNGLHDLILKIHKEAKPVLRFDKHGIE